MIRALLVAGALSGATLLGIAASSYGDLAFAQPAKPAPTAAQVLADVQKTYAAARGVKVTFEQTVKNTTFGTTTTNKGTMFLSKPDLFRFDYVGKKSPLQKAIIFDGKDLWVIEPDKTQIIQTTVTPGTLPTAITFWNGASLTTQYNAAFATKSSQGAPSGGTVVELTPKQPMNDVKVAYLVVDTATNTVTQTVVINTNGDLSSFAFGKADLAATNAPTTFQVNPSAFPTFKLVKNPGAPAAAPPASPPAKPASPPAKPAPPATKAA